MAETTGYIDSVYCGSGVDGKGLRCIVFFSGCNLRCPFCHNPETLFKQGKRVETGEIINKLLRYKGYFRRGGVTLSGGEPFLQREFFLTLAKGLHEQKIHVCVETNGHICDSELIAASDSILCDVKNQETDDLSVYDTFFAECRKQDKDLQITNVLVPGKNDSEEKITNLARFVKKYFPEHKVKFLPFRKLCEEKYRELNQPFAYSEIREAENEDLDKVENLFDISAD